MNPTNTYGPVTIVGPGPLTNRFKLIAQEGRKPYLVWADTMRYRLDAKPHELDVRQEKL